MVFLSVYTPTYGRPVMLEQCQTSVRAQTVPVDHVIVHDYIGLGIDGMYAAIPEHAHIPTGEYVMVLSDDNVLVDDTFAEELERVAESEGMPDVIVFRGQIESSLQPLVWRDEPQLFRIDLSCFAVRRDVWVRHAMDWGHSYTGDFDFIHTLWDEGYRFVWWDRLAFRALQISRGAKETMA